MSLLRSLPVPPVRHRLLSRILSLGVLAAGVTVPAAVLAQKAAPKPSVAPAANATGAAPSAELRATAATADAPGAPKRTLRLEEALELAKKNHPALAAARADALSAHARADIARAPLLPQLSGQLSAQRSSRSVTSTIDGVSGIVRAQSSFSAQIVLDQQLWDFGRNWSSWRASKATASAQDEAANLTELTTLLTASTSYFDALAQGELVEVARETLANQQRYLSQIVAYIQVGSRPEIDRAQAKTDTATAKVQLIQAENGFSVAKARLKLAIGMDSDEDFSLDREQVPALADEDATMETLLRQAIDRRPEFAQLRFQLEANARNQSGAWADFAPIIGVRGSVGKFGQEFNDLGTGWTATATLNWPLFDGLATPAQIRSLEAQEVSLTASQSQQRQQLRLDLTDAQLAIRAARASVEASGEAVTNARERLRLAEGRYQTGVGQILELSDAQLQLTNARAQQIQAEYSLGTARVRLQALLGGA